MLRLLYAIEFLLALIAAYTAWSQIGGQGSLDAMPWYWKAGLGTGLSFAAVKATAAAVAGPRAWNSRTLRWLSIILALSLACGAVTYYYHPADQLPEDEESTTPPSRTAL